MTHKELVDISDRIFKLATDERMAEALAALRQLVLQCGHIEYENRLDNNRDTYRNMLKYSFEKGDDPEKKKVYNRLVKSVLELSDDVRETLLEKENMIPYYRRKASARAGFEEVSEWVEIQITLGDAGLIQEAKEQTQTEGYCKTVDCLFTYFWLNDELKERDISLLNKILGTTSFSWYYTSVLISALTFALLRKFDSKKFLALFDFYRTQEEKIRLRALTGLLINFYFHDERVLLYPELTDRLKLYEGDEKWNKTSEAIIIQLLRAKDTEKVAEKIKTEIIPEIWKMKSKFEDKINIDDLLKDGLPEDKNPEWERFFNETPDLYKKFEEFSTMQSEGADVFMTAFSMLKNFSFFNDMSNWFIPFYKENPYFLEKFAALGEKFDSEKFLEGLESSGFLCNSDKYSFCLNVTNLPEMQRNMMIEMFNMEIQAMNEMAADDKILRKDVINRSEIVKYVQDLYRFFKLHPLHRDFKDIFRADFDFHNKQLFPLLVDEKEIIRNMAEFFFSKNHFGQALEIFVSLEENDEGFEMLEKMAYSYQSLGDYQKAIQYYKKAEIVSKPGTWLYNKIAFCNRKLKNFEEALHYYEESEKLDPESLYIQTSIGQVYMEMSDFEKALKYFFKVEYLAPDNLKVHRPIAWCSFVLAKIDTAEKYFRKIVEKEANKYDYMNLGHVMWVRGDKANAIVNYQRSYKLSGSDHEWFLKTMKDDSGYLREFGIPQFDISLMADYIRLSVIEK